MKRPRSLQRAAHARLHVSTKGRRTAVEPLEERFALNAAPATAAAQTQANAASFNPSPSLDSAAAALSAQAAAAPSAPVAQGILDLLFTPHRPKSAVPADVISGIGPALQQGAPIIYSFELEDNLTGSERGDSRARENPQGPAVPLFVQPELANIGNVDSTPYGMPNFSFGPDTWVFGPQGAPSPQGRVIHRPENPGSGVSPPREQAPSSGPDETTTPALDDDRRSSLPPARPLDQDSVRLRLDGFVSPESVSFGVRQQSRPAVDPNAVDRLIVDENPPTK